MGLLNDHMFKPLSYAFRSLPGQFRSNIRWLALVLGALSIVSGFLWYLHFNTHMQVTEVFADPVALAGLPIHFGTLEYLSASVMIVAGAILLFVGWAASELARSMRWFAVVLGLFILWLGLDDVYMIHEWIGLRLAILIGSEDIGLDRQWLESFVFGAYALAWIGISVVFARQILRTGWLLLGLCLVGFAASILFDLYSFIDFLPDPVTYNEQQLFQAIEDVAKLGGGFFALAYALQFGHSAVRGTYSADSPEPRINES